MVIFMRGDTLSFKVAVCPLQSIAYFPLYCGNRKCYFQSQVHKCLCTVKTLIYMQAMKMAKTKELLPMDRLVCVSGLD